VSKTTRRSKRTCHKPVATPCGEMFVAEIENRGRKFVTKKGTLTSSMGGAKCFNVASDALDTAEKYIATHFSN